MGESRGCYPMGRYCSACTSVEIDANNCSCSQGQTRNSLDGKEASNSSTVQISLLRGDPTEGSRGSSCGSREFFFPMVSEGSHDRSKHRRELPLYQKLLQRAPGNVEGTRDSTRSFMDERPMNPLGKSVSGTDGSQGGTPSQGSERFRWKDGTSLASGGMERSTTSHNKTWGVQNETPSKESWSSRSRSGSFQDVQYEQSKSSDREKKSDADASLELSLSGRGVMDREEQSSGHEKSVTVGKTDSTAVERSWLHEIVTEPISQMAQKLQEVPDGFIESLKICLREILGSSKRKAEFARLQRTLQRRSDLTTDSLLQSHRSQLEILVALKTGIPAFLHPDVTLTTAALAEIFLGTRCRNVGCQSLLPADDCECKVCSSRWGFCNACMCVVCSKFDFDANTCSWIGCDFCLHWCHADCGIRVGHISSRKGTSRPSGDSVMQFRCSGCGHTSELYGFVQEVFTACARDWSLEVLARELQCIRRIFHRSEDLRGKQLFGKAEQLLVKLDSSRDVDAVWQSMMKFFAAGQKGAAVPKPSSEVHAVRDAIPLPRERDMMSRHVDAMSVNFHATKAANGEGTTESEKDRAPFRFSAQEGGEDIHEAAELLCERAWQKAQLEELENILKIKQAEAKLFQMRADEVSREAEGLQRIVKAKIEKFDEEYKHKLVKLCISARLHSEMGMRS